MKKTILALLLTLSFIGCKKKDDKPDTSLKTITYTFVPNGANSDVSFKSIQQGTQIYAGEKNTLFSVNDQVAIGDKTTLQMKTTNRNTVPTKYEIRITYNNKQIGFSDKVEYDGASRHIILQKTFTKEDFQ